jgi:hypothetical protein
MSNPTPNDIALAELAKKNEANFKKVIEDRMNAPAKPQALSPHDQAAMAALKNGTFGPRLGSTPYQAQPHLSPEQEARRGKLTPEELLELGNRLLLEKGK